MEILRRNKEMVYRKETAKS